jgi:hypothetical protein
MANPRKLKIAVWSLALLLFASLSWSGYLLFQNYWWKRSLDKVADQAGMAQAMSTFRSGRLVLWEIDTTNDATGFSGRRDGPFEIWFDEYHSELPSPWNYAQRRMNQAHNATMRRMYEHPPKFRTNVLQSTTNVSR